jgi:hypothetical protein
MALQDLVINRLWLDRSVTDEINWDAIRVPTLEFALATNNNLKQVGLDVFGTTYEFMNEGKATRSTALIDTADVILIDDDPVAVTGAWTFITIPNLGIVDTAIIAGGTVDGTEIGGASAAAGTFSNLIVTSDINGACMIPAQAFRCTGTGVGLDVVDLISTPGMLKNSIGTFSAATFYAPVSLPHGATLANFRLYYYRDDAAASLTSRLVRMTVGGSVTTMVSVTADDATGYAYEQNQVISYPIIDNLNYYYWVETTIDNNNSIDDQGVVSIWLAYTTSINI